MRKLTTLLSFLILAIPVQAFEHSDKTLFIVGSTSISKVIEITKKPFHERTGINIITRPIGSDKGVISIAEGVSDIGIISRYLTEAEQTKWPKLTQYTFAQDAIIFLVNKKNAINNLNSETVKNIYTGEKATWKSGEKITLFTKGKGHGTLSSFMNFFQLASMKQSPTTLSFRKARINQLYSNVPATMYDQINQAIGWVSRSPNAIAYESLGAYISFAKKQAPDHVKLLKFEDEDPLIEGKPNPKYKLKRPLNILTGESPSPEVNSYISFLMSEHGQKILQQNNLFSLVQ